MPRQRAFCEQHRYFAGRSWKSEAEAESDFKEHIRYYPGDNVSIEEMQDDAATAENMHMVGEGFKNALHMLEKEESGEESMEYGACMVSLPTGETRCYRLTPEQCRAVNGEYLGGPCHTAP